MRIKIDYAEINKHLFNVINDPNMAEILETYISDYYFNGADKAVIYIANNPEFEYIEFDILPG